MMQSNLKKISPSSSLLLLGLIFVIQFLLNHILGKVHFSFFILLSQWGLLFGASILLITKLGIPLKNAISFSKPSKTIIQYTLLATITLAITFEYFLYFSELAFPPSPEYKSFLKEMASINSITEGLWKAFYLGLTPAICEEIFFRGILQQSFKNKLSPLWSISLAALLFALMHGSPWHFHLYFLMGIFLGWLFEMSGSLWVSILAHFTNNLWALLNGASKNGWIENRPFETFDLFIMLLSITACIWFIRQLISKGKGAQYRKI